MRFVAVALEAVLGTKGFDDPFEAVGAGLGEDRRGGDRTGPLGQAQGAHPHEKPRHEKSAHPLPIIADPGPDSHPNRLVRPGPFLAR